MNPKLLEDLILAGHRVACKTNGLNRIVFLFIDGVGYFQGTQVQNSIEASLSEGISNITYTKEEIQEDFTGEYKIVTPLPQLPQVGDTVKVLEICRELYGFDDLDDDIKDDIKDMIGKKYIVEESNERYVLLNEIHFTPRMVAKCEHQKAQSIVSEETFGEIIELNGKKYREII